MKGQDSDANKATTPARRAPSRPARVCRAPRVLRPHPWRTEGTRRARYARGRRRPSARPAGTIDRGRSCRDRAVPWQTLRTAAKAVVMVGRVVNVAVPMMGTMQLPGGTSDDELLAYSRRLYTAPFIPPANPVSSSACRYLGRGEHATPILEDDWAHANCGSSHWPVSSPDTGNAARSALQCGCTGHPTTWSTCRSFSCLR
jgi:hypothetical protein